MYLKNFLEDVPLYIKKEINIDALTSSSDLKLPKLDLYCTYRDCGDYRIYETTESFGKINLSSESGFRKLPYRCKNCGYNFKHYYISYRIHDNGLEIQKIGEYPSFGNRVPDKVLDIFG